jgi:HAD superfamily phosphoserine phosphatase-like hydrolase
MPNIIAFDLNKTLVKENSWYDLNLAMGITSQEDELLYRLSPEGEGILTYAEWIDILARLMKARGKASRENIEKVILNFNYLDGAKETIKAMKDRGFMVGLITGALSPIAEKVAKDLTMDFVYCNARMEFGNDNMLKAVRLQGEYFAVKVDAVTDLHQRHPDVQEVYYVADGDTDEAIFKVTKGIMVTADQQLHEDWKRQALEDGEEFSAQRAAKAAWKVVDDITKVTELV